MKQGLAIILTAALMLTACGGGQTDSSDSGDNGQDPGNGTISVSYRIPDYPKLDDFTYKVYIDPAAADGGDGSIDRPYDNWSDVAGSIQPDTAYLFKAGTYNFIPTGIQENFNDNYIGMYGTGEKPVIESNYGYVLAIGESANVVFENLHLQKAGSADSPYALIVRMYDDHGNPGIVLANNIIEGVDSGEGYPAYCMKGSADYSILYHNEFKYSENDGIYGAFWENASIVSNYFHHNNMGGVESTTSTGDSFQMEDGYVSNAYIANNYFDRHHTNWKFTLIVNSWSDKTSNLTAEYNTFVSPKYSSAGGAAVRWYAGAVNKFRKNLIDTTSGLPGVAGYIDFVLQDDPYGVRDNHFVGTGVMWYEGDDSDLPPSNLKFDSWADYNQYMADNEVQKYGSDIDPNNFWGN